MKSVMTIFLLILSLSIYNTSFAKARKQVVDNVNNSYNKEVEDINKDNEKIDKPDNQKNQEIHIDFSDKKLLIEVLNTSYIYKDLITMHGEDKVIEGLRGKLTPSNLSDNRLVKVINARIAYDESNTITKILGFGYSKVGNVSYDMENDLQAIFYYYGYLGFAIYILYILYFLIKMFICFLKKTKGIFDGEFVILGILLVLLIAGGEYSGAYLRKSNANIYLSFYLAYIYFKCEKIKLENNKKK